MYWYLLAKNHTYCYWFNKCARQKTTCWNTQAPVWQAFYSESQLGCSAVRLFVRSAHSQNEVFYVRATKATPEPTTITCPKAIQNSEKVASRVFGIKSIVNVLKRTVFVIRRSPLVGLLRIKTPRIVYFSFSSQKRKENNSNTKILKTHK